MKKLYLRILRDIKNNFGQFLSIVLVIAIGSALLSGMFSAINGIEESVDGYYSSQNLADIWAYYKGITADEVTTLSQQDGIAQAQGRYTFNADLKLGDNDSTLRIHSLTNINIPYVTSGSLPENKFECVIDQKYAEVNGIEIGQKISLNLDDPSLCLTVTGFCLDPEYAYKIKDATTAIVDDKTFGYAYANDDTLIELNRHGDVYSEAQNEIDKQLSDAENGINDAKSALADKQSEYEENQSEAEASLADAYQNLNNVKSQLDAAQSDLNAKLNDFKKQISDQQSQLDAARSTLDSKKAQLDAGYESYQKIRDTLAEVDQQAQDAVWNKQYATLNAQYDDLSSSQQKLEEQSKEGLDHFAAKQSDLNTQYKTYETNLASLKEREKTTNAGLADAQAELSDAQIQIQDKEADLANLKTDAQKELDTIACSYQEVLFKVSDYGAAEAAINNNENVITYVERKDQSSYAMVKDSLDPIRTVSYVFPMIFYVVAAIIVFIAMSKNIEGQRTQIAVMQALGISKGRIRWSFLVYAGICSLFGSILFALIGFELIPGILVRSVTSRFAFPAIRVPLKAVFIGVTFVIALLFSGAATLLAIGKVIKEAPAQAMRPRPPKNSKAILAERIHPLWKRLSYSSKLILRNIFLNKTRVILSSVGIIGSVMLLITGLSLKNSAQTVINWAIDGMNYDLRVTYTDSVTDKDALSFAYPARQVELTQSLGTTVKLDGGVDTTLQILEENSSLVKLFDQNGNLLPIGPDSVIIPKSMADTYHLQIGDTITVTIDNRDYELTITGIAVQYAAQTMDISYPAAQAAGMDTSSKTALVSLRDSADIDAAAQAVSLQDGVKSVNTKDNMIQRSREMMGTLNTMIYIIIFGAAVLSVSVIYNITSIVIFERTREFATLMVLGYYKKEINRLVFVENMATTAFGCLIGIPCGAALFRYLIGLISTDNLSFPSALNPVVTAAAVLITFLFSMLANILLMPKIKKIKPVEALKSVE